MLRARHRNGATLAAMHIDTLSQPEQRVLGCLIEKRFTTPDQYPLTLNALRLACNQSTNRDPVVHYDEDTVRDSAQRMARYGLTRLASGHSSRAVKYRHLADETLAVSQEQLAVLAVLLLRGAQTPGELKARTERMVHWGSLSDVDTVLDQLIERDYAQPLARRPGQKEERFEHRLGVAGDSASSVQPGSGVQPVASGHPEPSAAPGFTASVAPTPGQRQGPAGAGQGRSEHDELLARIETLESRFDRLAEAVEELLGP
jgi:uncharacterized protein